MDELIAAGRSVCDRRLLLRASGASDHRYSKNKHSVREPPRRLIQVLLGRSWSDERQAASDERLQPKEIDELMNLMISSLNFSSE